MVTLSLEWAGGLEFRNGPGSPAINLQSDNPAVASPPEALAYAVMGCMAMDVVEVLRKGRHELRAVRVTFQGERAADPPRRFLSMRLHFDVSTTAEASAVERAIELSRTKYCSVWHTIRPDVAFETAYSLDNGRSST